MACADDGKQTRGGGVRVDAESASASANTKTQKEWLTSLDFPFLFLTPCSSTDMTLLLEEEEG